MSLGDAEETMASVEAALFERHATSVDTRSLPIVSILASPRTGSTLVYQILDECFDVWPLSNLVNDGFAEHPVVGVALETRLRELLNPEGPTFTSAYGKTEGILGPSEASAVMRRWFGGEHPTETRSARVLPGAESHLLRSLNAMHGITERAILMKNAWNCFRVEEWARLIPSTRFLWVRRDLLASALSDLEARYRRGGPEVWNSATTANHEEIRARPYWEQVVEVQYAYQRRLESDLSRFAESRWIDVWYEDLCEQTESTLARIEEFLCREPLRITRRQSECPTLGVSVGAQVNDEDRQRVSTFARSESRFRPYLRELES